MTVLKVTEAIARFLKVPSFKIQPATNLIKEFKMSRDNIDSLIYDLGNEFGIMISDNYAKKIKTVNDILLYFETHKTNHVPE